MKINLKIIYMCVCVCVCIYVYIYVYTVYMYCIYMYVRMIIQRTKPPESNVGASL